MKEHPEALKAIGLTPQQASTILNYVNGRRSVLEIRDSVAAELDEDVPPAAVMSYLELLRSVRWVTF